MLDKWEKLKSYLHRNVELTPQLEQLIAAVDHLFEPTPRHAGSGYQLNRGEIEYFCLTSAKRTAAEWAEFWGCSPGVVECRARQYGVSLRVRALRWDPIGKEYFVDCAADKTAREWAELFDVTAKTILSYAYLNNVECKRERKAARHKKWTEGEDELIRRKDRSTEDLATIMQRSRAAVEKRARDIRAPISRTRN